MVAEGGSILAAPETWVAVGFVGFIGALIWAKVPAKIASALDQRGDGIRNQIDEARTLREEAQALLAQYQREQQDAEKTASEMIEHAEEEAKRLTKQAEVEFEELITRKRAVAVEKIEQAEAKAVASVRSAAAEVAINAARRVLEDHAADPESIALIDQSISELDDKLH